MTVIGFRASRDHIRYAVIELDTAGQIVWLNGLEPHEHKWNVPKSADTKSKALVEVHKEASRILDKYKPQSVSIKVAEKIAGGPSPDRVAVEAVITLACGERGIPVQEKLYSQLKPSKTVSMNSKVVQAHVLTLVPQPPKYWDVEIADALLSALREIGK